MSELMTPISFRQLMTWIVAEHDREGSVFGVHRPFRPNGKTLMLDRQLVGIDEEAENAHILEAAKKLWGDLNHRKY